MAENGLPQDDVLKRQMRASRRRFVTHLQREMGKSLRKRALDEAGSDIPNDPYLWGVDGSPPR